MLKKIFMVFAVFFAIQISVANAEEVVPTVPLEVSVSSVDAKNNLVKIKVWRKANWVSSCSYKLYNSANQEILSGGENFVDENFALIKLNYADLANENPAPLFVAVQADLEKYYRGFPDKGTYKINFVRAGGKIFSEVVLLK